MVNDRVNGMVIVMVIHSTQFISLLGEASQLDREAGAQ